jgi:emp24/gp25L/p24 family/GOLD
MKDVIITITPRDSMGVMIAPRTMQHQNNHDNNNNHTPPEHVPKKHREPLERRQGSFDYYTGALHDGTLEVCIQSYTANVEHPSRIAFRLQVKTNVHDVEAILEQERQVLAEQMHVEHRMVMGETSRITAELVRLHRRARGLMENAEQTKQSEMEFHHVSDQLNLMVKCWYLFRVLLLVVGGYIQASYIIKHMKSRHYNW